MNGFIHWWKGVRFEVDGSSTMLSAFVISSLLLALFGAFVTYVTPRSEIQWRLPASLCIEARGIVWRRA